MQLLKDRKQRQRLKQIKTIKTKIIESIFFFFFFFFFLPTFAQIARLYPTFEFMLMAPKTVYTF